MLSYVPIFIFVMLCRITAPTNTCHFLRESHEFSIDLGLTHRKLPILIYNIPYGFDTERLRHIRNPMIACISQHLNVFNADRWGRHSKLMPTTHVQTPIIYHHTNTRPKSPLSFSPGNAGKPEAWLITCWLTWPDFGAPHFL